MAQFRLLSIPSEDYDALGLTANSILETCILENGGLLIRKVTDDDLEEFVCDGDCENCPVADTDCDVECFSCPCYANCEDSDYQLPECCTFKEGACKSHGSRRDL